MNTNNNIKIAGEAIKASLKRLHNIDTDTLFSYPHSKQEPYLSNLFIDLVGDDTEYTSSLLYPPKLKETISAIGKTQNKAKAKQARVFLTQINALRQKYRIKHHRTAANNINRDEVVWQLRKHQTTDPESLFKNSKANREILDDIYHTFTGNYSESKTLRASFDVSSRAGKTFYQGYDIDKIKSLDEFIQYMKLTVIDRGLEHYVNIRGRKWDHLLKRESKSNKNKNKPSLTPKAVTTYIQKITGLENIDDLLRLKQVHYKTFSDIINCTYDHFIEDWIEEKDWMPDTSDDIYSSNRLGSVGHAKIDSIDKLVAEIQEFVEFE